MHHTNIEDAAFFTYLFHPARIVDAPLLSNAMPSSFKATESIPQALHRGMWQNPWCVVLRQPLFPRVVRSPLMPRAWSWRSIVSSKQSKQNARSKREQTNRRLTVHLMGSHQLRSLIVSPPVLAEVVQDCLLSLFAVQVCNCNLVAHLRLW